MTRLPSAATAHARAVPALACECQPAKRRDSGWFRALESIVLAIAGAACVITLVAVIDGVERRVHELAGGSKVDIATVTVKKYVFEAYPVWRSANPDARCPPSLGALNEYMNLRDIRDPWGEPYEMYCGRNGIVVHSLGEDNVRNNDDDIWSNQ